MNTATLKGKKILVTGWAGFIGSHLLKRLLKEGADVHLVLRAKGGNARIKEIEKLNFMNLYEKGYTSIILNSKEFDQPFTKLPMNIKLNHSRKLKSNQKLLGSIPNFIIKKNGEVHFAIINGFIVGVKSPFGEVENALVD